MLKKILFISLFFLLSHTSLVLAQTEPGFNVGDRVNTSDTYGKNGSLYQPGTANTTGNGISVPAGGGIGSTNGNGISVPAGGGIGSTNKGDGTGITPTSGSEGLKLNGKTGEDYTNAAKDAQKVINDREATKAKEAEAARDVECAASQSCIDKTSFVIDTGLFSIGGNGLKGYSSKETINNTLGNIIQKLMIALGVVALFVMTIGAGYMILYHGQDEYLSKGKNIFMGGITALVAALCSYYLVNLVGYILYK